MLASTSSLGFAAFLLMKGYKLSGSPMKARHKYRFNFTMEPTDMNDRYQEYAASEFHNFDTLVQNLKRNLREVDENFNPLSS